MPERPRVAVVGVGTIGAMVLWRLAQRGVAAEGFEHFAPGHDRGAAGGQTRIFRTAYREGAEYIPLLRHARKLWRELEAESQRDLLTLTGGLTIGAPDDPEVRTVLESARRHDIPHEVIDDPRHVPMHRLDQDEIAVLDHEAGFLRAEACVVAATDQAEQLGATIHRYTSIEECQPANHGVRLRVGGELREFDHVVWTPGPWCTEAPLLSHLPVTARQITIAWFAARHHRRFVPEHTPIAIRTGDNALSFVPALDHAGAKIIPKIARPDLASPDSLPRSVPTETARDIGAIAADLVPSVHPDPIRIGTYTDGFTPDGHALVGRVPGSDAVTVLTGFSGHGFKMAPVFGDIASDLVLLGDTAHDIAHLDPARFDIR